jgi:hypothetical protein
MKIGQKITISGGPLSASNGQPGGSRKIIMRSKNKNRNSECAFTKDGYVKNDLLVDIVPVKDKPVKGTKTPNYKNSYQLLQDSS